MGRAPRGRTTAVPRRANKSLRFHAATGLFRRSEDARADRSDERDCRWPEEGCDLLGAAERWSRRQPLTACRAAQRLARRARPQERVV